MEILLLPWLFIKILCVLLLNMKISQFHIFSIESVALCCDVTHIARLTIVPLHNWCGSPMWYPNNGNNIIIPEYFGSKCSFVAAMTDTLPNSMLLILICSVKACQTQRGGRQHAHAYFSALTRWIFYWVSYHFINILVYICPFSMTERLFASTVEWNIVRIIHYRFLRWSYFVSTSTPLLYSVMRDFVLCQEASLSANSFEITRILFTTNFHFSQKSIGVMNTCTCDFLFLSPFNLLLIDDIK